MKPHALKWRSLFNILWPISCLLFSKYSALSLWRRQCVLRLYKQYDQNNQKEGHRYGRLCIRLFLRGFSWKFPSSQRHKGTSYLLWYVLLTSAEVGVFWPVVYGMRSVYREVVFGLDFETENKHLARWFQDFWTATELRRPLSSLPLC
jgi:hypothetical protein